MNLEIDFVQEVLPVAIPILAGLVALGLVFSIIGRLRNRVTRRRPQYVKEVKLVSNLIVGLLSFIIVMGTLEVLNVPLGNVWTAISTLLALVAIGFFAVWSILSHMTAAVVLFFQRPFRNGEYLQFGDEEYYGKVVRTGLFFTVVEDEESGLSQIPNNLLFQRRFRVFREKPVRS